MAFTQEQTAALSANLNRANVRERIQSGRKLSYIEGWLAIAEANRIFGFDAWTRETFDVRCVSERERKLGSGRDGWGVSYVAKVRVTVEGVVREGIGAGHGIDADLGLAHESAIKEAETDAMKRALMTFGNPFGLALYDKEQTHVVSDEAPAATRRVPTTPNPPHTGMSQNESQLARDMLISALAMAVTEADLMDWQERNKATIGKLMEADRQAVRDAYGDHKQALRGKAAA